MTTVAAQLTFDSLVSNAIHEHKEDLAHRHAFFLHKAIVMQVKKLKFSLPPKRIVAAPCDSTMDCEDLKSTPDTATTEDNSTNSQEILNLASETQGSTLNKVISILTQYEDHLQVHNLASGEVLKQIVHFNRAHLAYVLSHKQEFSSIPRDSVALTILLLNAERFNLNKTLFLKFVTETLQNKRISKISQLRRGKTYVLLSPRVNGIYGGLQA